MRLFVPIIASGFLLTTAFSHVLAQSGPDPVYDPALLQALQFRSIGPHRGGRVTAVEGIAERPYTFYMGTTGGGVWRTTNGGQTWHNVSDGYFAVGSIGAIDAADTDPDIIYVGTGSAAIRGNVSTGRGMYKSSDGAESWTFIGLEDAGQIARVRVHPSDPDLVYVAATGHPFGRNSQRGVFRTRDGGDSWEKVLFLSDSVGAIDLSMNPDNPDELYAAMWRGERKPWTMISGAHEGGVYKTTDGGDTWEKLENGLPTGLVGKIGVAISPANPSRVWAIVEAEAPDIGLYRSDDAGSSWVKISTHRGILSRPWYFYYLWPHPTDDDVLWVGNSGLYKSTDGGEQFSRIPMPHSDQHAMWINPITPEVIVEGNDGGATVSLDGGEMWSIQLNQPTAEFYSVTVDSQFPYRVYGPQQDNSTISIPNIVAGSGISFQHWLSHGGCETGPIAVRPDDPNIAYSGCFGGRLARFDYRTQQFRQIRDYPENQGGMPESNLRYRIQWNAPIVLSPHDPNVLYHGSQYVHRSTNEGQSWEVISPDLTGKDTIKFGMAGGPITHDITGVETYSSLLALAESPIRAGEIWTGSNDGKVFLTRDNGDTWTDITPPDLPEPSTVNRIDLSRHDPAKAYVTAYRYRLDDFAPYVYRTSDYGVNWTSLTDGANGIPGDHPVRAVREDPEREGLLFAGTEFGLFVSFDDGNRWQSLQLNLPVTPVTDLLVHRGDLVVATQGRAFWILDDITPLRDLSSTVTRAGAHLFQPRPTYRTSARGNVGHWDRDRIFGATLPRSWKGQNPPEGAIVYYSLAGRPDSVVVEILEDDGSLVRRFSGSSVPTDVGLNRFVWDLRYPRPRGGGMSGPRAAPGEYSVSVTANDWADTTTFEVLRDPRLTEVTDADLREQFDFLMQVRASFERLNDATSRIRNLRGEVDSAMSALGERAGSDIELLVEQVRLELQEIEGTLIQTRPGGWANQPKIRGHLSWVATAASSQRGIQYDSRPTDQLWERYRDLDAELDQAIMRLERLVEEQVHRLRELIRGVAEDKNG